MIKHGGRGAGHISRWPKAAASLTEQLLAALSGTEYGVYDLTDSGNVTTDAGDITTVANSVSGGAAALTQGTSGNRPDYSTFATFVQANPDYLILNYDSVGAAGTAIVIVMRTSDNTFALVGEGGGVTTNDAGVVVDGSSNVNLLNGVDIEVDGTVYEAGTATPDQVHTDLANGNWRTVALPSYDTSAFASLYFGCRGNTTLGLAGDIAWIGVVPDAQKAPAVTVANAVRDGL